MKHTRVATGEELPAYMNTDLKLKKEKKSL